MNADLQNQLLQLDRQLIDHCRALSAPPPEDVSPEAHREALWEEIEKLSEELKDKDFGATRFSFRSPIYSQSVWKYWQEILSATENHIITNDEMEQLYDLAVNSSELGVRFLFRRFISQQDIVYRWSDHDNNTCVDDRIASAFNSTLSGGLFFNFSPYTRNMHINQDGFLSYGYDPIQTVPVASHEIRWMDPARRDKMEKETALWVMSETPRNVDDLLDNPEQFLFENGLAKAAALDYHFTAVRNNITNVTMVQQEINNLFSLLVDAAAVEATTLAILSHVIDSELVDQGTKHLYVHFVDLAVRRANTKTGENKSNFTRMARFARKLNTLPFEEKEKAKAAFAKATRQDYVAISYWLKQGGLAPIGVVQQKRLDDFIVPDSVRRKYESMEALAQAWDDETLMNPPDYEIDEALLKKFESEDYIPMRKDHFQKTDALIKKAKIITTPLLQSPTGGSHGEVIGGVAGIGGLLLEQQFLAPLAEARGLTQAFGNMGKMLFRWLGLSAAIYGFGTVASDGVDFMTLSSDELIEEED